MPTGPSFTAIVVFQVPSSTISTSVAPGMQGTTRSGSSRSARVSAGEAGTSNSCWSFTVPPRRLARAYANTVPRA